ncbi:MAG: hypothetical protein FWD03_05325, partial [Defluviitaleaceae bacterium]|nr:hypothetical protein [Defluviitaleaceae bacterium]
VVDGQRFELWGYDGDGPMPAFRLQDIAYILNGTSAQFGIRELTDDRFDFWIDTGTPHTMTGAELQPIPEDRWVILGSYGFVDGHGLNPDFRRTAIVGIGGGDIPDTAIAMDVIDDVDDTYFNLRDFGYLLGFTIDFDWDDDGFAYIVTFHPDATPTIPVQTPELVDLLLRINGHWVDREFYDSLIIDEHIVWPAELSIGPNGFTELGSGSPIGPMHDWDTGWQRRGLHALSKTILENGLVELTIDPTGHVLTWNWWGMHNEDEPGYEPERQYQMARLSNHKIIVDPGQQPIEEIIYYIGDTAHHMTRFNWDRDNWRYYAEPYEGGNIRILYMLRNQTLSSWDNEIMVYRSTVEGGRGERIYHHEAPAFYDRILFEFIDTSVEFGQIYFYSLYSTFGRVHPTERSLLGTGRQMVVDTSEILDQPVPTTPDMPEPEVLPMPDVSEVEAYISSEEVQNRPWLVWLVVVVVVLLVIVVVLVKKTKMSG